MVHKISLDYFNLPADKKYHIYRLAGSNVSETTHMHPYYQICYVDHGEVHHWHNGLYVSLLYGNAFIVPPGFIHRVVFPNNRSSIYSLSFEEGMFHNGFSQSHVYRFLTALSKNDSNDASASSVRLKVVLEENQRYIMRALMKSLIRESESECPQELTASGSLVAAILCVLSQAYFMYTIRSEENEVASHYSNSLQECINYIDSHFSDPLTLDFLSTKFALSKFTFSLLFPQYAGLTLKQYIIKKRIESAATLISTTTYSMSEIAQLVGYNEFSTFYRNFKRLLGIAPSEYRQILSTTDELLR